MASTCAFAVAAPLAASHSARLHLSRARRHCWVPAPLRSARHVAAAPPPARAASATMSSAAGDASTYRYVILGAGNAAGYAARRFVENGVEPGALCLIGDEDALPYERPALSKAFLFNPAVRLPGFNTCVGSGGDRQTAEWYAEHGIKMLTGCRATGLDAADKRVTLEDGSLVAASEALILATGADPIRLTRTPGHDLAGIHYLRNNQQGLALYDALQACKGKTVAVIGGGYIGMEVAAAAITVGCKVKMIFPEAHMMSRLFTAELAAPYEQLYRDKGVEYLTGRLGKEFLGDGAGRVRGVRVAREGQADEEVAADLVVVGVGAAPATGVFKGQVELDARGGVVVDGSLQTSAAGVYAIGDIATFPLKLYGDRPARMEHVQNCRDMAAHAVDAIVNKPADKPAYDYLPYFYSRVFHMSWQFFGDNAGECAAVSELDAAALRDWDGEGQHPQMVAVWTQGGAVQGIFMESPSAEDTENMKKLARARPTVDVAAFSASSTVADAWKVLLA